MSWPSEPKQSPAVILWLGLQKQVSQLSGGQDRNRLDNPRAAYKLYIIGAPKSLRQLSEEQTDCANFACRYLNHNSTTVPPYPVSASFRDSLGRSNRTAYKREKQMVKGSPPGCKTVNSEKLGSKSSEHGDGTVVMTPKTQGSLREYLFARLLNTTGPLC